MKVLVATVFAFLLALGVYLYFYLGAYKSPEISVGERGPLHLIYKDHLGPYHEIGPAIRAVEEWVQAQGLRCPRTFGEYLDNPDAVDQDRLRSRGGCLMPQAFTGSLPEGFHAEDRPQRRFVIAEFTGSPSIGPFRVYPRVEKYVQAQRLKTSGAVIEVYTVEGDRVTTEYLFPLENH